MTFTIWGMLIIASSLAIMMFKGKRGIVWAVAFTAPLFNTAVAKISLGNTELRTSFYFSIIFILIVFMPMLAKQKKIKISGDIYPSIIFLVIITISLIMPILYNDVSVIHMEGSVGDVGSLSFVPLQFSRSNLTQLVYPYFQILFFIVLSKYLIRERKIISILRIMVFSTFLVLLTGIFHMVMLKIGQTKLLSIMYNVTTGSSHFRGMASGGVLGLGRMYSWAGEPGYTSFLFLMIIGLFIGSIITNNYIYVRNKWSSYGIVLLLLFGIILTSGTTGYVGIIILFIVSITISFRKTAIKIKSRYIITTLISFVFLIIALQYFSGYSLIKYIKQSQLSKLTEFEGSGMVRYLVLQHNIANFFKSPLLGVGYGSDRSLALSTFLLSNSGILGFVSFIYLGWYLIKKMYQIIRSKFATANQITIATGLLISFSTMLILMQFSKSESSLLFQYFWIIAACMLSLNRIYNKEYLTVINYK